jgi:titin
LITGGAANNTIGGATFSDGNLISGNLSNGVTISSGASTNTVKSNKIGSNSSGFSAVPNLGAGVWMGSGAADNVIGDDYSNARNVISGNSSYGVLITGATTTGNSVAGNCIGVRIDSDAALANGSGGVRIESGAHDNTIGGETAADLNVISGNVGDGVLISGVGSVGNAVLGNHIGAKGDGILTVPNQAHGVELFGAVNNTIGPGNQISGNDLDGVYITDSAANNEVIGNLIGTSYTGTASLPNRSGVVLDAGATNNTIGGDTPVERNVISGNDENGVLISDTGTTGNMVVGNYIGLNSTGTGTVRNDYGVVITAGAQSNVIGEPGAGNVISASSFDGVVLSGASTSGNTIAANYIGTDAGGSVDLGNLQSGVHIHSGANANTIGGTSGSSGNLISGNNGEGVLIEGAGTDGNVLSGNIIGLDAGGTAELKNDVSGVSIASGAADNTVGGDVAGERNLISGNFGYGVTISGSDTDGNTVSGNYIGTDQSGLLAVDNFDGGVLIQGGAQFNTIGGDIAGERNVISGNDGQGVEITGSGTSNNTISGNFIGVASDGVSDLGNYSYGVRIQSGAGSNTIGGNGPHEGNVISGNGNSGLWLSNSSSNVLVRNVIGMGADGVTPLGNGSDGVRIDNGSSDNTVGPGNRIAYNSFSGVSVDGVASTGNVITENQIFANGHIYGIRLLSGANNGMTPAYINSVTGFPITISGTACAGCTAEVFANPVDQEEGRIYLGSAVADGSGNWSLVVGAIPAPYLTATATDAADGTSMFSYAYLSEVRSLFLPLIMR